MPIYINWDDPEETILHYRFQEPWDWTEFYNSTAQSRNLVEESRSGVVHYIIDLGSSRDVPRGTLSYFSRIAQDGHSNGNHNGHRSRFIFIQAEPLVEATQNIISYLFPDAHEIVYCAPNLDEARKLLNGHGE